MPRITVDGHEVDVECQPGETILEALHREGHALRVGCRRGGCGVCKVDVLSGEFAYHRPIADKVLTDEEKASGVCLTCRAEAVTDLHIRLRQDDLKRRTTLLAFYAAQQSAKGKTI